MIRFSIVIPVYKAQHTIRRCVESIEKNSCQDIEIILIEDGSPDQSWQVCQQLAEEYSNIKALHNEKNKGVSYTRNRGLEAVTGQYTMFADSDDWVDPDYYESFSHIIDRYDPELAICAYVNHDEKQNQRTDIIGWDDNEEVCVTSLKKELQLLYDGVLLQQLWNKSFRTSVIKEHRIRFDESISIGEDFRFILEYLKWIEGDTCVLLNRPLYHYMRDQEGSLMFRVGYESVEEPLKNLRKLYMLEGYSDEAIEDQIGRQRQQQIMQYAYLIMHNAGMKRKEKKRLILKLDPEQGIKLYHDNLLLYMKEKIARLI